MAYAPNLTERLFRAIEEKFNESADLLQLAGPLIRDFAPEGRRDTYPFVVVSQGEEGGVTEMASSSTGLGSADESFVINFDAFAETVQKASQIGWQLASNFDGWESAAGYDGIEIRGAYRQSPPWTGQAEQGVAQSSVSFTVSCAVREEE